MGGRHVADVVEIKREQGSQVALFEVAPQPGQAATPQAVEVDPLLPVDGIKPKAFQRHVISLRCRTMATRARTAPRRPPARPTG